VVVLEEATPALITMDREEVVGREDIAITLKIYSKVFNTP
jgi:hypothetical protein